MMCLEALENPVIFRRLDYLSKSVNVSRFVSGGPRLVI
jgi:hypothetical protein